MLIAYDSRTGNVKRFVNKLNFECVQIREDLLLNLPFVLITYTTGFGQVPEKVLVFLERNHKRLFGVAASGNRNWGGNFARSADIIAEMYNVPILHKFELAGFQSDVDYFTERVNQIWQKSCSV